VVAHRRRDATEDPAAIEDDMSTRKREKDAPGNADARLEAWTTEGAPLVDETTTGPRVRARDLGLFLGTCPPGENNAITDVGGVRVGHATVVHGSGRLEVGKGPARTGVTAIVPPGDVFMERLAAGGFVLNGAGEMMGFLQIDEWGLLETPIVLSNTLATGVCADAVVRFMLKKHPGIGREHDTILPVVAECDDSWLNDIGGRHVRDVHVFEALEKAKDGPLEEGSVGSGTGMMSFDFAGGIGTSSRVLPAREGGFTVGVLVQSNFGRTIDLRMGGLPVGPQLAPMFDKVHKRGGTYGSIICIVATDAPLTAHQLKRVSKRAALGIGRTGSHAGHGSGEVVLSFSTANVFPRSGRRILSLEVLSDEHIDPIFHAVVEATEEAILNAMCMAGDTIGANGHLAPGLPLDKVRDLVARSGFAVG
jgi:D-aminopeptidase